MTTAPDTPASNLVLLATSEGAKARLHLEGAHVVSWSPAGSDDDLLFVSAKSGFGPGIAVRGGIPVCFPQFGAEGTLPAHGFARTSTWTLVESQEGDREAHALLRLVDNDATRVLWPHGFTAELRVTIAGPMLSVTLRVENTGDTPFAFTAALHPYFRVDDAYATAIRGLAGSRYRDALRHRAEFTEESEPLLIDGEIDRVYFDVAGPVSLHAGARRVRIEHDEGFTDVVVWNPGADGVTRKPDMHTGDERKMICIEAGAIGRPVVLAPNAQWQGTQRMFSES